MESHHGSARADQRDPVLWTLRFASAYSAAFLALALALAVTQAARPQATLVSDPCCRSGLALSVGVYFALSLVPMLLLVAPVLAQGRRPARTRCAGAILVLPVLFLAALISETPAVLLALSLLDIAFVAFWPLRRRSAH